MISVENTQTTVKYCKNQVQVNLSGLSPSKRWISTAHPVQETFDGRVLADLMSHILGRADGLNHERVRAQSY